LVRSDRCRPKSRSGANICFWNDPLNYHFSILPNSSSFRSIVDVER
jgi:hypothetical protein